MYTYEQFKNVIKERILEFMPEEYQNAEVIQNEVIKGNDNKYSALSIRREGDVVTPNLNLDKYYRDYVERGEIDEIMKEMSDDYKEPMKISNSFLPFDFHSYEEVKPRLYMVVLNKEYNQEYLKNACAMDMPGVDMVAVPKVFCKSSGENGHASFLVNKQHLSLWNVTEVELCEHALKNTPILFPVELKNMREMMTELMNDSFGGDFDQELLGHLFSDQYKKQDNMFSLQPFEQYVLTNTARLNGATTILYPDLLKEIAKETGSNVFILPSSTHEVILMKDNGDMSAEELQRMVIEINRTQVAPEEVLSDEVYCYDCKEQKLVMATNKEQTREFIDHFINSGMEDSNPEREQENGDLENSM